MFLHERTYDEEEEEESRTHATTAMETIRRSHGYQRQIRWQHKPRPSVPLATNRKLERRGGEELQLNVGEGSQQ